MLWLRFDRWIWAKDLRGDFVSTPSPAIWKPSSNLGLHLFCLNYEEVNTVHSPAGKKHRLEIHSLSCTRGWLLLHHTSGRPREQVSCTAAGSWARLRTWWRTMFWWMWRDTFSAFSQVWSHVMSIFFYLLRAGHFGSRFTWVFGVVGYAFLSAEERIRKWG